MFIRCFAHNMLKGMVLVAALVALHATQGTAQQANPAGVLECWNPHTAQISTVQGDTCPVPVNPYK